MIVWLNDSLGLGAVAARSFSQCRDQDSPATLLHNAYFTRLWIVQEILLAPSTSLLLDGNVWMTWKAIREVVEHTPHDYGDYFKDTRSLIVPAFSRVSFAVDREEEDEYPMNNNSRSLRWLIDGFSSNSCDDPRDRVYSLMGLVEENMRISVDYNKTALEAHVDAGLAADALSSLQNYGFYFASSLARHMGFFGSEDRQALTHFFHLLYPWSSASEAEAQGVREHLDLGYRLTFRSILPRHGILRGLSK